MNQQIEQRLEELRREHETGTRQLQEWETRIRDLRETLLRISGAIQVLEELKSSEPEA